MESILTRITYDRKMFDPTNKDHLLAYKYFLDNNKWDGRCPFHLMWPFESVPEMIKTKLIDSYIDVIIKYSLKQETNA